MLYYNILWHNIDNHTLLLCGPRRRWERGQRKQRWRTVCLRTPQRTIWSDRYVFPTRSRQGCVSDAPWLANPMKQIIYVCHKAKRIVVNHCVLSEGSTGVSAQSTRCANPCHFHIFFLLQFLFQRITFCVFVAKLCFQLYSICQPPNSNPL